MYVYHTVIVKTQVTWIKDMERGADQGSLSTNNFYKVSGFLLY